MPHRLGEDEAGDDEHDQPEAAQDAVELPAETCRLPTTVRPASASRQPSRSSGVSTSPSPRIDTANLIPDDVEPDDRAASIAVGDGVAILD
jgi:hypothetical protein